MQQTSISARETRTAGCTRVLLRSIGSNAVDGVLEANGSCTVNMHRTPGGGVQRRGVEKAVGSAVDSGFWTSGRGEESFSFFFSVS